MNLLDGLKQKIKELNLATANFHRILGEMSILTTDRNNGGNLVEQFNTTFEELDQKRKDAADRVRQLESELYL